jgi:PAS domain S-box-containing protein
VKDPLSEIVPVFEQFFHQFPDAMFLFNRAGECMQANQACLDLFNYELKDLVGSDAGVVFGNREELQHFRTELEQGGLLKDCEIRLRRKDGTPIACRFTATSWRDKGQSLLGCAVVIRCVTAEKDLDHSLTSLLRISDKLNSTFDLDSLLDALVEQALELTGAETGCAGLRTAKGMSCDHFLQETNIVPLRYDCGRGTGWPGWTLAHGSHYLTNDALNDTVIVPEVRERFGITSGMCIPIIDSRKDVIAFLRFTTKSPAGSLRHKI